MKEALRNIIKTICCIISGVAVLVCIIDITIELIGIGRYEGFLDMLGIQNGFEKTLILSYALLFLWIVFYFIKRKLDK